MVRFLKLKSALCVLSCGVLVAACLLPAQAFADSTTGCDPIATGLWTGVSFISGMQFNCHGDPVTSANTGQSSSAPAVLSGKYVALGDSVAAGLGLPLDSTSPNNPGCGVSAQAYPADVAKSLSMPYQNVSCSGATAGDLVTDQSVSGSDTEIQPQLDTAFANGTPSLITITAGANDVYWSSFLHECYMSACGNSTDQAIFSGLQKVLSVKLAYALSDINSRSNGNPPPVIVTGYYQPLSSACAQTQSNVTSAEISWMTARTADLNKTISDVASNYSFVRFAPVDFSGHELCTNDPWVQGPSDAAPFHPTAQGQQAIANDVLAHMQ